MPIKKHEPEDINNIFEIKVSNCFIIWNFY